MVSLEPYGNLIREMIAQNLSHTDISMNLLQLGVQQGCSEMSVRRFCAHHNISTRGHLSNTKLEVAISRAINQVGYFGFLRFTEVGSKELHYLIRFLDKLYFGVVLHHLHTFTFT